MDITDRYWVVQCPHCGRVMVYENAIYKSTKVRESLNVYKKSFTKKCPYCRKSFTIIRKREFSDKIVKYTTNNPREASEYVRRYKLLMKKI